METRIYVCSGWYRTQLDALIGLGIKEKHWIMTHESQPDCDVGHRYYIFKVRESAKTSIEAILD